jgi:hypothetical protein
MRTLLITISLFAATFSLAEPVDDPTMKLPAKGSIQDTDGGKHWYQTTVAREDYFIGEGITGETYRLKFKEGDYLPNDDGSKMVLANIISRFFKGSFVHADGNFETQFSDWKKAKGLQRKGYFIPCTNYPKIRIWIDLILSDDGKHIKEVVVANGVPT